VKLDKDGWSDTRISGTIKKVILPVGGYDVTITSKEMADDINLADAFTFMDPTLDPLPLDHGVAGDEITITGSFFGTKKPKLYLEYEVNGKQMKKSCKIISEPPYMVPQTGASELTFVVPKGIPLLTSCTLKLANKVGFAETSFLIF
jgi:hypothetical protein